MTSSPSEPALAERAVDAKPPSVVLDVVAALAAAPSGRREAGKAGGAPHPSTPTSVLDGAPPSPASSSAASSVAGCDAGAAEGAPALAPASDVAAAAAAPPPLLLHRRSILLAQRARGSLAAPRMPAPEPNTRGQAVTAVATLGLFFCAAAALPLLIAAATLAALFLRSPVAAAVLATFIALTLVPPGRKSQAFRHARVWDAWRRHFRLRASVPAVPYVREDKNYMVVMAPHSVFPMGTWLNAAITDVPAGGMPRNVEAVVANVLLRVPIYKHLFAWIGCHRADASTVRRLLRDRSVAICPEGIAGTFHGAARGDDDETLFLASRRGFVRVAIQAGAPLLPVYHIGASQLLRFVGWPRLSRWLRATVGFWCGVWGSPLPHRHDVVTVVGEPIDVVQCDDPPPDQVEAVHAAFCEAMVALFDSHKHLLGREWEGKKMRII